MLGELPYEVVEIPGQDGDRILITTSSTSQYFNNPSGSKSPWWMISMQVDGKEILSSSVSTKPFDTFAELYGFQIEASRTTSPDIGNKLITSAMIRHEDCIVVIPYGGYVANIENKMYAGTRIGIINISCLGWIKGKLEVYQRITFTNPFITSVTHDLDRAFVRFRVMKKNHSYIVFNQIGEKGGQSICVLDLAANIVGS